MKTVPTFSAFVFILLSFFGHSYSFARDHVDSLEESSIEFIQLQAVLSSRIIHFRWDVEKEINGDYFMIEKSIDEGENWSEITRVKSLQNHKERHTYEISEINMAQEAHEIFRICRVDSKGEKSILDAVDFNYPILSNMKLIPDPKKANRAVTVSCESLIESKGSLYIYDSEGELMSVSDMPLSDGYNRQEVVLKNLKSGTYLITVRNEFNEGVSRQLTVY